MIVRSSDSNYIYLITGIAENKKSFNLPSNILATLNKQKLLIMFMYIYHMVSTYSVMSFIEVSALISVMCTTVTYWK